MNGIKTCFRRFFALALLILLLMTMGGCTGPAAGNKEINLQQLAAESEAREAQKLEQLKTDAADLDRHYGEGRYAKDYTHVTETLNAAFRQKLKAELEAKTEADVIVRGGLVFFNDELDRAQKENLTLEDLLKDPHRSVKDANVEMYVFTDFQMDSGKDYESLGGVDSDAVRDYFRGMSAQFLRSTARKPVFVCREFDKSALKDKPLSELEKLEDLNSYLLDGKYYYRMRREDTTFSWEGNAKYVETARKLLKEKYGEDFMVLSPTVKVNNGTYICAPVNKPELAFGMQLNVPVMNQMTDKYLSVLAQQALNPKIEAILKAHGLEDKVVYLNSLDDMRDVPFDTRNLNGEIPFINLPMSGPDLDLTLYYLQSAGEPLDAVALRKAAIELQQLFPIGSMDAMAKSVHLYFRTFFYELNAEDRITVLRLMENRHLTAGELNPEGSIFNLETMQVIKADTDGFNYLFSHGTKGEYILEINTPVETVSESNFIENYKTNDIWR